MSSRDQYLVSEFVRILKKNASAEFINLDDKFTEKFDFFILPIETILKETGTSISPNRWSYHRIALVTEGSADYVCGIYKFKAVKHTLVNIPERVIAASEWQPESKGFFILFNPEFFLQHYLSPKYLENKKTLLPSVQPFLHLTDEQATTIATSCSAMLDLKQSDDPNRNQILALRLAELILTVEQLYDEVTIHTVPDSPSDMVKRFAASVEQNFLKEKSVSFYAAQLGVHPNHLNAVIKAQTGYTAKESIQNRLILEAKYLLHHTRLSIKEIAYQTGFEDPNYFGVFFKRIEHISPAAYRASFI